MSKKISFITERMLIGHGVDLVINKLAEGLSGIGYECRVYCTQIDSEYKKQIKYDVSLIPCFHSSNVVRLERKVRELKYIFNSLDTDLFIINTFPYYSIAGVLNKPVISINYGVVSTEGMKLKRKLFYKYMDFTENNFYFKKSSWIISISEFLNNKLPNRLKKKSSVIYLGADHYKNNYLAKENIEEEAKKLRENLGVLENDVLLLYVGRLNPINQPYKGTVELIDIYKEANKSNNRLKLLMVGFGSKNDEIALKNEGICVISNASFEIMPIIYTAADIYTTCTKWEGFDLPIAEAQTFGKPAICYNIGAHPEIMEDNLTGYMVKSREDFLSKLIKLSFEPALIKEMGRKAVESSKRFTWEKTVEQYDKQIKKILEDTPYKTRDRKKYAVSNLKPFTPDLVKMKHDENQTELHVPLSVIIINYNSSIECLRECLNSLKNQTFKDFKVLLFDNGSTNDTISVISDEFASRINSEVIGNKNDNISSNNSETGLKLQIIKNDSNVGLSKAINMSLDNINSEYVLISSFDVVYDFEAIDELMQAIKESDEEVIGIAPKIKFAYQRNFIESVGTYLDTSLYDGYQGMGQLDLHQYDVAEDIFGVSFTSALIKTEYFNPAKVGKVEEDFFLFYEDFDFCYRAKMLGYKFKSCPKAVVYHKYAYNFREESTAFQTIYYYKRLNLLKLLLKNCEQKTINRLLPIELGIMRSNLKDRNMKNTSRRIISEFKKSKKYILKKRKILQLKRLVNDHNIMKYCWGEKNFFNFITNNPEFVIENLTRTYQRLFVITGSNKYLEYVNYLTSMGNTKLIFDHKILTQKLHNKFENEPISVHDFIDKL